MFEVSGDEGGLSAFVALGFAQNFAVVTLGNIIGGILVAALVCWLVYLQKG